MPSSKSAPKVLIPYHQPLFWLVSLIIFIATLLRVWNLPNTLEFLGDQGRDAIIVSRIFKEGDLVFIGPVTSVGNMYLGPLYYYFMVPWLWLSYPSPLGPAYAIALLGVTTVYLLYKLGKDLVGVKAAVLASFLYAISAVTIQFSRFSWNPNPAPFVSLIMVWASYQAWQKNKWYWIVVATCFAVLLQLHYLTLLSAGGAGLIWLLQLWQERRKSNQLQKLGLVTALAVVIVLVSLTPLILFDYKHNWLNVQAFQKLLVGEPNFKVTSDRTTWQAVTSLLKETHGRSIHILFEISAGLRRNVNNLFLVTTVVCLTLYLKKKTSLHHHGLVVLLSYLIVGIIGTAAYEHTVFHHYVAYLFPLSFLIIGFVLAELSQIRFVGKLLVAAFLGYYLAYNYPLWPLKTIGWTIADQQKVVASIYERVQPGEKYNIVLLTGTGDIDAQNYRYFLEATSKPPLKIEQRGETETLFIINEDKKIPKVVDSPIYEIVVFPNKEVREFYEVEDGPEITVLRK